MLFSIPELVELLKKHSPVVLSKLDDCWFNATSGAWKDLCDQLPCTAWLAWPGYYTAAYETTIGGTDVVIQCWKGWCQRPIPTVQRLGSTRKVSFPGGIGAEVGIYRRDPDRPSFNLWELGESRNRSILNGSADLHPVFDPVTGALVGIEMPYVPTDDTNLTAVELAMRLNALAHLPRSQNPRILADSYQGLNPEMAEHSSDWLLQRFTSDAMNDSVRNTEGAMFVAQRALLPFVDHKFAPLDQWFPANTVVKKSKLPVSFTLSDPHFGDPLISNYSTRTYWTCKWMHRDDYDEKWYPRWKLRNATPSAPEPPDFDYHELKLDFTVAGVKYKWHEGTTIELA
jgi:hypothetical protein